MRDNKRVFRNFALPIPTFEYMKNFQRDYETRFGAKLTNNQVLILILSEHQQMQLVMRQQGWDMSMSTPQALAKAA